MRKLFGFVFIIVFIVACSEGRPSDVLPQEKMREVMWDMMKAGEFMEAYILNRDTSIDKAAEAMAWNNKVYELHNITRAQFEKSYAYYKDHPAMMKQILDTLGKRDLPSDSTNTAAVTDTSKLKDSAVKPPPAEDSIQAREAATPRKDSVAPKINIPVIDPLSSRGKKRQAIIDSIKRSRFLQRMKPLEQ